MVTTLHGLAFALYLVAVGSLAGSLARGRRRVALGSLVFVTAAVIAHGAALAVYTGTFGELPLVGLAPSLSTLAFLIGGLQVATSGLREARPLGLVLAPLAALFTGIALILGFAPAGEPLAFRGAWFGLHVVLAFIGYAGLAVAFAAGLLFLLQLRTLEGKRFGRIFRFFPSLDATDRLGRLALLVGFPALTLALLLGWAWTVRFEGAINAGDPHVLWAVITWVIFLAALAVRWREPGRGRMAALASVIGFVVIVISFVALRLTMVGGRFL